jgi:hypothetical protein
MLDATPLLRLYASRRAAKLAALDPLEAQRLQLRRLVRRAQDTKFGRDHGFAGIRDVREYQRRVPLRRYEDFWRDYWQGPFPMLSDVSWPGTIPYFALTSGTTTGQTKYIPVSHEMNAANRRAVLDLLSFHVLNRPHSRLLGGRNFMLGGSTDLVELVPGIRSGDLSGIAAAEVPLWARPRYFPPRKYALIADWERKIDQLASLSLDVDVRSISGTPSWLLLFFAKLAAVRPERLARVVSFYPNFELLIHGAVSFEPYRHQFDELLQGSHAETREVYSASEGFIAVADRDYGEGMRLIVDGGLFYELVPIEEIDKPDATRHWLATVEPGVNYAMVLSSCAGAWCYILGDTVRLVERDPPRLLITGRLSYSLSAFGEHLIEEEIEGAVTEAAAAIGGEVTDFAVGPLFPRTVKERGGHLFIVEFSRPVDVEQIGLFAKKLDQSLSARNSDYNAHRSGGFGMAAPRVLIAGSGAFAAWMKKRGQLGGQHKVPRVIADDASLRSLEDFMRHYASGDGSSPVHSGR